MAKYCLLTKTGAEYGLPVVWAGSAKACIQKLNERDKDIVSQYPAQIIQGGNLALGVAIFEEPKAPTGKMAQGDKVDTLNGNKVTREPVWVADPDYVAPSVYTDLQLAQMSKKAEMAQARYDEEVGGLDVNGTQVATDRESQTKIVAARIMAKEDPAYTVDWKADNGFVTLDATTIIAIADAVLAHIQGVFAKEKTKIAAIEAAATVEEVNAIAW